MLTPELRPLKCYSCGGFLTPLVVDGKLVYLNCGCGIRKGHKQPTSLGGSVTAENGPFPVLLSWMAM